MTYVSFNLRHPHGLHYNRHPKADEIIKWIHNNCSNYNFNWTKDRVALGVALRDEDATLIKLKYDFLFTVGAASRSSNLASK